MGERDTGRWRIRLVEECEPALPVLWRPRPELGAEEPSPPRPDQSGMLALLAALGRLGRRGGGPGAWAAPLADDPLAFVLDAMADAINVWSATGQLLYSNRAALELELGWPGGPKVELVGNGDRQYERRCLASTMGGARYFVEVIRRTR